MSASVLSPSAELAPPAAPQAVAEAQAVAPAPAAELPRAPAPAPFYRPELDLLRLGAFALVFVHHWLPIEGEWYAAHGVGAHLAGALAGGARALGRGVDVFFVLSAYLITELLLRERERFGRVDVRAFWVRRALRIWPLYWAFLVAAFVVVLPALGERVRPVHAIAFALFAGNWSTAFVGYPNLVIAPLWSVGVEEQFYIAWPLLAARVGRRGFLRLCVGLAVAATLVRALLAARGVAQPGVWTNTCARLDLFAAGGLLALWLRGRVPALSAAARGGLIAGALAALFVVGVWGPQDGWGTLWSYLLAACASVALVVAVLGVRVAERGRVVAEALRFGRISYGLYVFHMLMLQLAIRLVPGESASGLLARGAIALPLTLGAGLLSYRFLERPFLRYKDAFARVRSRPT